MKDRLLIYIHLLQYVKEQQLDCEYIVAQKMAEIKITFHRHW